MKKRVLSVLLVGIMAVSMMTGCADQAASEMDEISENAEQAEDPVSGTVGDKWYASCIAESMTEEIEASVKDDFYTAANLDYLAGLTIDEGYSSAGVFHDADQIMRERTLGLLQEEDPESHDGKLVSQFYDFAMDWEKRDEAGSGPIMDTVEQIRGIRTVDDMTGYETSTEGISHAMLSNFSVENSLADPGDHTVGIYATGLFLGDAQEYSERSENGELDEAYYDKVIHYMLDKLGFSKEEADKVWTDCMAFETAIAEHMLTLEDYYADDIYDKIINTYTLEELRGAQGDYPLVEILQAYGLDGSDTYNLYEPEWLSGLSALYREENVEIIKNCMLAHYVVDMAELLDRETYDTVQEYANERYGMSGSRSEEEMGLDAVNEYLSEPLDHVYIDRYCSAEERQKVIDMIHEFETYYREMLKQEDWLTEETKQRAIEKLDHITIRACYPDARQDYSSLTFPSGAENGTYLGAIQAITAYELSLEQEKVNQKVNPDLWNMSTREVNAYYDPSDNSINILCGTLVGAFDLDQPYEAVLATVGAQTIGHEISHAFDTSGAQFDKSGNYDDWWEESDYEAFNERADRLVKYMDQIIPYEGSQAVNGELVKGEMIADLGGMKAALMMAQDIEDFDYDAFFRAAAKGWAMIQTKNVVISQMQSDPHPLSNLRVNIPLQNCDEFMETYDIRPDDGMYLAPEDRVNVW